MAAKQLRTLPPLALEFMAWEKTDVDDRIPPSQREWCLAHGVTENTPARWKRSPAWLKHEAMQEMEDDVFSEGNISSVVQALYEASMTGDVQAMKAYVQYAAALEEPDDALVRGMSDEELAAALLEAHEEVKARLAVA